ncbi:MAG: DUF1002 domain-containing protein [Lachnospiraceae bacterium]|nr:DUF1002 domain-containing protein [Lachnospiraceae bacterium]
MQKTMNTAQNNGKDKRRIAKRLTAAVLAVVMISLAAMSVRADSTDCVVALGADLSASERAVVLEGLGLTEETLAKNKVITVTNAEEHEYLDSYLPKDVIGTRALSSCKVTKTAKGTGIHVVTHNISYCTESMYENALATAGLENAEVIVAGPFSLSGTAALVGAIKAYGEQEGIHISPENIDVSTDEIVVTSQLAETIEDPKKAAELIAAAKKIVAEQDLTDEEKIGKVIDELSVKMEITLTEEERQTIINLMIRISKLDLDVEALTRQAGNVYEELKNQGIDLSQYGISESDLNGILGFFVKIWNLIKGLFH